MIISACTHPCDTITFTHSLTRIHLLQLKIHNNWMKFLRNEKIFHLGIKNISTLNSYIYIYICFLIYVYIYFLVDSLSKVKIFPTFSGQVIVFYFLTDFVLKCNIFWHMSFYCSSFFCFKKNNTAISNFSVLPHKNKSYWLFM